MNFKRAQQDARNRNRHSTLATRIRIRRMMFESLEDRRMLASWSGDIPNGTVWTSNEVQRIVGDVRVPAGATLTIQAGTIVKFNEFASYDILVEGRILANGTAASPVVFTSLRDDTGLDGVLGTADDQDTNGNGPSNGGNGDWNAIQLLPGSSGHVFDNVQIRYGGTGATGALVASVPMTLSNSLVRNSASSGVRLQTSNSTLTTNVYKDNSGAAISIDLASNPAITGVTVSGNGSNALVLDSGTLVGNGFWNDRDIVYRLNGDVTVPATSTLTIGPGQIIKFRTFASDDLFVDGKLIADGTPASKIIFTSDRDDTAGGDTNNNGATGGNNGDWNSIQLRTGSVGHLLDNVEVRFGGTGNAGSLVASVPMTLTNSSVINSASSGVRLQTSNSTLTTNTFKNNSVAAISMDLASNPLISGVTMVNNVANALILDPGTMVGNGFWDDKDIVYRLTGDVTVPVGSTLTVGAGQVVKFRMFANDDLIVNGKLIADGTPTSKIIFTSDRDDTAGGDTNNNGATLGNNGDWNSIHLAAGSAGHLLDNVEVRNGGTGNAASLVASVPMTLTNSLVVNSASSGVRLQTSNSTLTANTFKNNSVAAISMDLASNPVITGVTMVNNVANALILDPGTMVGNGFWDDKDIAYRLTGDVTVPVGSTLTVGAGQIVKFRMFANDDLIVDGKLIADGTPTSKIIFTSDRDDTAGGDTNNNGATTGNNGDWNSIQLRTGSSGHILDNVEVRFGGTANPASLVASVPMTLTNSMVVNSASSGVRLQTSNSTLTTNTFKNNSVAAISMDLASNPVITGVTMQNNVANALILDSGNLVGNGIWDDKDIVYRLTGDVTVPVGKTLTIGAGQIVKFRMFAGDDLLVDGKLIADGTPTLPIVFTSDRDDTVGGDTNNNGATNGNNGDWNSIQLRSGSSGHILDNVEIRFGGTGNPASLVASVPMGLTSSVIANSSSAGVRLQTSNSTLTANTFKNNGIAAISMDLASNPTITGVTMQNNAANALILDTGSLVGNGFWDDKDIVYRLTGDVTVPVGNTLTIGAGQNVKFRMFAGDDLIVGGRLIAKGNASSSITFTSDRDDSAGGDTNNNEASFGNIGDWGTVQLNSGALGTTLENVEFRFGGGGQPATFVASGGIHSVLNSVIRQSGSSGFMFTDGATATIANSIIHHNVQVGVRAQTGARVTVQNSTLDSNGRGALIDGSLTRITLTNNLITNNSAPGIAVTNSAVASINFNLLFANAGSNYEGIPDQTGQNGNLATDPLYFNVAAHQYSVRAGSPAIDSATSALSPTRDFFGNRRYDDLNVMNQGVGLARFFDRGAIERQENSASDIDLATVDVTIPSNLTPNELFTIQWTVRNLGSGTAIGPWSDAVYLSDNQRWDASDKLLGRIDHLGDLGASLQYTNSASLPFLAEHPGRYYIIVRTDDSKKQFEGINTINNVGIPSTPAIVAMPRLVQNTIVQGAFSSTSKSKYYELDVPKGTTVTLRLDSKAASGGTEIYVRKNAIPSRSDFDYRSTSTFQPDQELRIPTIGQGTYYVLAFADFGAASQTAYDIIAQIETFAASSVSPNTGTGQITLSITGTAIANDVQVELVEVNIVGGNEVLGNSIVANSVQYVDATKVYATFVKSAFPASGSQLYRVRLKQDASNALTQGASGKYTYQANAAEGKITTELVMPSRVRFGQPVRATLKYRNDGLSDVTAPIFVLESTNAKLRRSITDALSNPKVEFLGINVSGPAGVLPPDSQGSIDFIIDPIVAGSVDVSVKMANPELNINWNSEKNDLRPDDVPADAWDVVFENFKAMVGNTVEGFQNKLAEAASYLSSVGVYTSDVSRLLSFIFSHASGYGTIVSRYRQGAFGRSIPDLTDFRAETDQLGNVVVHLAGTYRPFIKTAANTFLGISGDSGILVFADGQFRLREADQSNTIFRSDGKLDYAEDRNGNRLTPIYAGNRITGFQDPKGNKTLYILNAAGKVTQATSPVGSVTNYQYDSTGELLTAISGPDGTLKISYFDGPSLQKKFAVTAIELPDGSKQFFEYDALGRISKITQDTPSNQTTFSYLGMGQTKLTYANGESFTQLINDFNQPAETRDSLGHITKYFYDENQNISKVVNQSGAEANYAFDAIGNIIKVEDVAGNITTLNYGANSRQLQSLFDPRGQVTSFGYDGSGNSVMQTDARGRTEQYVYDETGKLIQLIGKDLKSIRFAYDQQDRLVSKSPDGMQSSFYSYDINNNLKSITRGSESILFQYDAANRVTNVSYPKGRFLSYTYDSIGRRIQMKDQSGQTTNYQYDKDKLVSLTNAAGNQIVQYTYDSLGRMVKISNGNGTSAEYSYSGDGRVARIVHKNKTGAAQSEFNYSYDLEGRLTSTRSTEGTTSYQYNALNELTQVTLPSGRIISYEYDAVGNRKRVIDNGATTSYATNGLNQYSSIGGNVNEYDRSGNLVLRRSNTSDSAFTYDAQGNLTSVITPSDSIVYEYDALGNRSATISNGQRTEFLVDPMGLGNVVAEFNSSGALLASYQVGQGLVSRTDSNGLSHYYDADAVGNIIGMTGTSGSYVNQYRYLPFGERLSKTESVPNPFEFGGLMGVMSDPSGLNYMRKRYYDPAMGRFTSPDPIGLQGHDTNLYRYSYNRPTELADPTGNLAFIPIAIFAGKALLVLGGIAAAASGVGNVYANYDDSHGADHVITDALSRAQDNGMKGTDAWLHSYTTVAQQGHTMDNDIARKYINSRAWVEYSSWKRTTAVTLTVANGGYYLVKKGVWIAADLGFPYFEYWLRANKNDPTSRPNLTQLGYGVRGAWEGVSGNPWPTYIMPTGKALNGGTRVGGGRMDAVTSVDPNDISGPQGFGPQRYVAENQTFGYHIVFENKPSATAAAALVTITQQLDPDLDWSTFEFGDLGFGDIYVAVEEGRRKIDRRLDLSDSLGEYVDVTADVDSVTGIVTWVFASIDPKTGELTTDPDGGFLPPNQTPPEGDGFVTYRINAKKSLSSGTQVDARASIIFDQNAAINTPDYRNTIDAGVPLSRVNALPAQAGTTFTVSWSGQDESGGSGVASYDVFVSDNGGAYALFKDNVTTTSASFTGVLDHTYRFYSVATDNVGHQELAPATADTQTVVKQLSWQNVSKAEDVDNNGKIFPIDALLVINELNARKYQDPVTKRFLPKTDPNLPFLDVNGDGFSFPIDALLVINELNRQGPGGGEGEGSALQPTLPSKNKHFGALADSVWLDDLLVDQSNQGTFSRRGRNRR